MLRYLYTQYGIITFIKRASRYEWRLIEAPSDSDSAAHPVPSE